MSKSTVNLHKVYIQLAAFRKELAAAPEGYLEIRDRRFYHVVNRNRAGVKKNVAMVKALCRKKYIILAIENLEGFLKNPFKPESLKTPGEIIASMPDSFQQLDVSYFYHPNVFQWLSRDVQYNTINLQRKKHATNRGDMVRSIAERDIANFLNQVGLLYEYDSLMQLNGKTLSPDFHILNPFTNEVFLWEHYGLLSDADYLKSMNTKMDTYIGAGWVEGYDLILSFEYHIWNPKRVLNLIRTQVFNVHAKG